eukprot:jgi/Chrpa1/25463/Chrysochromulina_OHIO_Genome00027440-RA
MAAQLLAFTTVTTRPSSLVLERDEEPYHAAGGYKLHGCWLLPDGAHVVKLLDSGMHHHKLWLRGTLCGHFQLYSRFYYADAGRRSAVRQHLSHELLCAARTPSRSRQQCCGESAG